MVLKRLWSLVRVRQGREGLTAMATFLTLASRWRLKVVVHAPHHLVQAKRVATESGGVFVGSTGRVAQFDFADTDKARSAYNELSEKFELQLFQIREQDEDDD